MDISPLQSLFNSATATCLSSSPSPLLYFSPFPLFFSLFTPTIGQPFLWLTYLIIFIYLHQLHSLQMFKEPQKGC